MANVDASYAYRYFTADLLTNKIFGEIPFKGVTYERALKGAGSFNGSIGLSPETVKLDIYNTTLPGKTALYVVRNNVCVWGGIIWGRSYNVIDRKLNVSASEFTSYLYHRRAWRTWTNKFTADLTVASGVVTATINDGMTFTLNEESTVHVIMSDINYFGYNGYYQLTADSTLDETTQIATFTTSATTVATPTLASVTLPDGNYPGVTIDVHANTYDYVRSLIEGVSGDFNGTHFPNTEIEPAQGTTLAITNRGIADGVATISMNATPSLIPGQEFRVSNVGVNFDGYHTVSSVSGNSITYNSGGGSVTYAAITPVSFRATSRNLKTGTALITTDAAHGMYVGQSVTLSGLDNPQFANSLYDGTVTVTTIPSSTSFTYETGTKLNEGYTALSPATVTKASLRNKGITALSGNGTRMIYTCSNSFSVGQYVTVTGNSNPTYNVKLARITAATSTNFTIKSSVSTSGTISVNPANVTATAYALVYARQSSSGNASIATSENHNFDIVGNTVTVDVAGVNDTVTVVARQLVNNVVTLTTSEVHNYSIGTYVTVSGITDTVPVESGSMSISGNTATFTLNLTRGHNLHAGNTITVTNVSDTYSVTGYSYVYATSTLTVNTSGTPNLDSGDVVKISGVSRRPVSCTGVYINNKIVRLTAPANHNVQANDKIFVTGYKTTKTLTVSSVTKLGKTSKKVTNYSLVNIKFSTKHGLKAGVYITTSWPTAIGSGNFAAGRFKATKVIDDYTLQYDDKIDFAGNVTSVTSPGTVAAEYSYGVNGWWIVSSVASTYIYFKSDTAVNTAFAADSTTVTVEDAVNAEVTVSGVGTNFFTVIPFTGYTVDRSRSGLTATATVANGIFNVTDATIVSTPSNSSVTYTKDTTTYPKLMTPFAKRSLTGQTTALSPYFNTSGAAIVTVSSNQFTFALATPVQKTIENAMTNPTGVATAASIFNGTGISATITAGAGLSYSVGGSYTTAARRVFGLATGKSNQEIKYGTYGGYTNNSDLLFEFSDAGYSTTQTLPVDFRGYETRSIGEELDKYSDVINGFEYRVDCSYDPVTNKFKRIFVLLPILPTSLTAYLSTLPGGVLYLNTAAPPSAFGADQFVFHFPGNISDISIDESAENSATRFFMVGNIGELADGASQPYAVAVDTSLLNPTTGTMTAWPLLDDTHTDQNIYDESLLYSYAQRYLAEAKPPDMKINVTVNGSITPPVGSYSPGDWCTLIVNDDFIKQRLTNDLEPRSDVMIRKIDGLTVSVPDGATFPEKITLTLVPEWQADQIGK